jgi:plastocyanin
MGMVSTDSPAPAVLGTVARLAAAAAVLVSGLVHLQLYFDGFRDFSDANLGRSFLLNAIASVVLAVVLVFRRDVIVRIAAAGLLASTLIAFVLTRSDVEVFGFTESGLNPSPQALIALVAEVVGLVALGLTFVPRIGAGRELRPVVAIPIGAAAVALAVVGGALWARSDSAAPAEASSGGAVVVTIADFEFLSETTEVPVGTTVEWVNADSFDHSIAAEDGSFQSPDIGSGQRFSFTFTEPGTYEYMCAIHPTMRGTIVVT